MTVNFDATNSVVITTFGDGAQIGGPATYTPQTGSPFPIDGVFDEAWRELEFTRGRHGASLPVSTTKPAFGCRASDFPTGIQPAQGDTLTRFNGQSFTVADVRPDGVSGSSWVYLILN